MTAADCARKAAARARNRESGYYAGKLKSGNDYEGQINARTNLVEGCGVMIESDGGRYEGQLYDGNWHGHGVRTTKDGLRYEGGYSAGKTNGFGVVRFNNGDEGRLTCTQSVFTGPGVWINANGVRYDGDFALLRWSGFGVLRYADASTFAGQFADGDINGLGVRTEPSGKKQYGRWEKGVYKGLE